MSKRVSTIGPALALILAAASFQTGAVMAKAGPDESTGATAKTPDAVLAEAQGLIDAGKVIRARHLVQTLVESSTTLSEAQVAKCHELASFVRTRLNSMDANEVSLQKADLELELGNLSVATRHAGAVARSEKAKPAQTARAAELTAKIADRQAELAPIVASLLTQAERDFMAGRYGDAKAALEAVVRSGVVLTREQARIADRYQSRIVDLELAKGEKFQATANLGMLQPGAVRPSDPNQPAAPAGPQGEQPTGQPPAAPAAAQPPAEPAPAPVEPPANQPPAEPTPQPDLIAQSMTAEALSLLAQADQAYGEASYVKARDLYRRLRTEFGSFLTAEQAAHVAARFDEATTRLGVQPGEGTLGTEVAIREAINKQTQAEFDNLLDQARRALQTGDTAVARQRVAAAILKMNGARDFFAPKSHEANIQTAQSLLSDIASAEQTIAANNAEKAARDLEEEARVQQAEASRVREARIKELIDRARAYQQDMRYDEALQTVDQLLFLDPINPTGLLLQEVYQHIIIYQRYNRLQVAKQNRYALIGLDNEEATLPPVGIVNFPEDWKSISFRRGDAQAFQESPENRRVLAELESRRLPTVAFTNNSLNDVLSFVQTVTQINLDTNWEALNEIGIAPETSVSLNLKNVSVRSLLDKIVAKVSTDPRSPASWSVVDGIVTFSSDEDLRKKSNLYIYDIRDLLLDVPDYDEVPEIDLQNALRQSNGGGGQSPFRAQGGNENTFEDRRTLEERTQDIIDIIQENIDPEGWADAGGEPGRIQQLGGSLIITQTDKAHREISSLLGKLRQQRAMQINVETRFLLVNQDFFEQIGFDLDVYLNANNNQVRAAQATDRSIQGSDFFNFGTATIGQRGPGLNRIVTSGTGVEQGTFNPRPWSPISFAQDSFGLARALAPQAGIAADIISASPALGIAGQFLDDIQVDFLVTATQADRRSIQLTAPRLTFTNGQIANIYVATQTAFVSDLEPIVGDSAVGFDPTVDVVTEGVTLLVEGVISSDRRYVTMNVDAGVARIDGFANQAVTAVAGGQLVNSADTQSFIQLPTVTVTRVRTTVTVPDQGTVLLGGQRIITEFEVETGVPVLSKLPILNRFFSNRFESKEEQTLLILIKPTVLIQSEQEERNFPGLINDALSSGFSG